MIPGAALCHASPRRVRLRIPTMRGDEEYFRAVERSLSGRFGKVVANPMTGSVLLTESDISREHLSRIAAAEGLFELGDATRAVVSGVLGARGADALGWPTAAAGLLLLLAAMQFARGQTLAPAVSLFWYALEALRWGREKA